MDSDTTKKKECGFSSDSFSKITEIGVEEDCLPYVTPLRNETDYINARKIVDKLSIKGEAQLTQIEMDHLEVLSILMEKYEDQHHNIERLNLSPVDFLKLLMTESGMNSSDLGRLLGDRPLGHRILKGERHLSKAHIKILSEYFRVNASAFL
jgi:HTH-type transcriptional regulator / antitoxin HigA